MGSTCKKILKQSQYQPYPLNEEVILLFAGTNGFADAIPLERIALWKVELLRYMEGSYASVGRSILEKKLISPDTEALLRKAIGEFNRAFR